MNGLPHATRADALIQAYLEGALSETQEQELRSWLAENPEHVREFARQIQMDLALWDRHAIAADVQHSVAALPTAGARPTFATHADTRPRLRSRWLAPLAMAASLALVVGGWWLTQGRQPTGLGLRVVEVSGEANIQHSTPNTQHSSGERVVTGMELRQGDRVVVAQGGKIGLKYDSEETTIGLVGTATFENRAGGKFVRLEPGHFTCSAAPQSKPFRIQSPHALATVVGTRFNIEVFDAKTALVVSEGKVQFERDGQTLLVGSNQIAEASAEGLKMLPPPVAAVPPGAPRALAGKVIRKWSWPGIAGLAWCGIAFDGSVLWLNNGVRTNSALLKVNPMTGAVIGRLEVDTIGAASSRAMSGLAWDGTRLWVSVLEGDMSARKNSLCAVDPVTGRLVRTLNAPADMSVATVAVGGGYLWCLAHETSNPEVRKVAKLDPSSGAVAACWQVPTDVGKAYGLEYMHDALWLAGADGRKVFKLNPADGRVLGSFDAPELEHSPGSKDGICQLAKSGTAGQLWMIGRYEWVYLVEVGEDK